MKGIVNDSLKKYGFLLNAAFIVMIFFVVKNYGWLSREALFLCYPGTALFILGKSALMAIGEVKRVIHFLDLKEFSEHQNLTIDALNDIFETETYHSQFTIPTMLTGVLKGADQLTSPFSSSPCLGYHLIVGLVKNNDTSNNFLKYTSLLLEETQSRNCELVQGKDRIKVAGGAILNLKEERGEMMDWKGINSLPRGLQDMINSALGVKNINKTDFTGIYIREELLLDDEQYTVFGICRMVKQQILIEGSNIPDDPGSLYITSLTGRERERLIGEHKKNITARRLSLFLPLVIFLGLGGFYFYSENTSRDGALEYVYSPAPYRIEIEGFADYESSLTWTLDQNKQSTVDLTSDGELVHVTARSQAKIFDILTEEETFTVGLDEGIVFKDTFWQLTTNGEMPSREKKTVTHKKGRIYIKNSTDRTFTFSFIQAAGNITGDSSWVFNPREGYENELGYYLYHPATRDGETVEEIIYLETGDTVLIKENKALISSYILGYTDLFIYLEDLEAWQFTVTSNSIKANNARFYIQNPSLSDYTFTPLDFDGKALYATTWEIESGEGTEYENGTYLTYTHQDDTSEPVLLSPGKKVKINLQKYDLKWEGSLGDCPFAVYDRSRDYWTFKIN